MSEPVLVLGCGPAGLLAAHAVALSGRQPIILSRKVPSSIGGAQYLHSEIPGLSLQPYECTFRKVGTRGGYALKVYGGEDHPTSWEKYEAGAHRVWNMRDAYQRLWAEYHGAIVDREVTPELVEKLAEDNRVISTIPKIATCPNPQDFDWRQQAVWIMYGEDVPNVEARDMEILMSGDPTHRWYRQSNLFGWKGIEFPFEVPGGVKVLKPVATTYPGVPNVRHMGRYGEWRKEVLVHDVFWDTIKMMEE